MCPHGYTLTTYSKILENRGQGSVLVYIPVRTLLGVLECLTSLRNNSNTTALQTALSRQNLKPAAAVLSVLLLPTYATRHQFMIALSTAVVILVRRQQVHGTRLLHVNVARMILRPVYDTQDLAGNMRVPLDSWRHIKNKINIPTTDSRDPTTSTDALC